MYIQIACYNILLVYLKNNNKNPLALMIFLSYMYMSNITYQLHTYEMRQMLYDLCKSFPNVDMLMNYSFLCLSCFSSISMSTYLARRRNGLHLRMH